jgi:hypothetical protein
MLDTANHFTTNAAVLRYLRAQGFTSYTYSPQGTPRRSLGRVVRVPNSQAVLRRGTLALCVTLPGLSNHDLRPMGGSVVLLRAKTVNGPKLEMFSSVYDLGLNGVVYETARALSLLDQLTS